MDRGLGSAALFLLEAHRPLLGLGGQLLGAFGPLVQAGLGIDLDDVAAILREPEQVARLTQRIEEIQGELNAGARKRH